MFNFVCAVFIWGVTHYLVPKAFCAKSFFLWIEVWIVLYGVVWDLSSEIALRMCQSAYWVERRKLRQQLIFFLLIANESF